VVARRLSGLLALALACVRAPDFYVRDTGVYVETRAPFAGDPGFPARLESTVDAALAYWGGDWDALAGRTITLTGDRSVTCRGAPALGCYDGDVRITTSDPAIGTFACVEETVLVHEIGHAVIGDSLHEDPRWMDLMPVSAALSGRTGFSADGEVECTIFVSVWRHPPGA
jgi:hypothetical protein